MNKRYFALNLKNCKTLIKVVIKNCNYILILVVKTCINIELNAIIISKEVIVYVKKKDN
jgi:hypothetical protein